MFICDSLFINKQGMRFLLRVIYLAIVVLFVSCEKKKSNSERFIIPETEANVNEKKSNIREQYIAHKVDQKIVIDGELDAVWEKAELSKLNTYYNNATTPDHAALTTIRLLWDKKYIYVFFDVKDNYINGNITERDALTYLDDCAEVFFSPILEKPEFHFCMESSVTEATNDIVFLNDYVGADKDPVVIKGYNPNYKLKVKVNGTINNNTDIDEGWTMEIAWPLKSFTRVSELNPIKEGTEWLFMAIRQDRDGKNDRATATNFPITDFSKGVHQPKEFGRLLFLK